MPLKKYIRLIEGGGATMPLSVLVLTRDGSRTLGKLADNSEVVFGRVGRDGTVVISASKHVSRSAFVVRAEPGGFVRVRCTQRQGTIEAKRVDGLVAGNLGDGEEALFRAPIRLSLHTSAGAEATIVVDPDRHVFPDRTRASLIDPTDTVTVGWTLSRIQSPPGGADWYVAAALAAVLLRRGRRMDPGYTLPRGVLLRACGQWLGTPKSEGWLASKFKQSGDALAVRFDSNPSQQLAEYVLANGLLNESAVRAIDAELERRRRR